MHAYIRLAPRLFRLFSTHAPPSAPNVSGQLGRRRTVRDLLKLYKSKTPIAMITATDYQSAKSADQAGAEIILVGDSLGMVTYGMQSTKTVTMDMMVLATKAVTAGSSGAFVVADMPFGSYHITPAVAVANAFRLVQEGGCDAVKLEGASTEILQAIRRIRSAGIPVMAHLGLLPQTAGSLTGMTMQGKTLSEAKRLMKEVVRLTRTGCDFLLLECVTSSVTKKIAEEVSVPTIGIGSGPHCSGQVLVQADMLGLYESPPWFCKQYVNLSPVIKDAIKQYVNEVKSAQFPNADTTKDLKTEESKKAVTTAWNEVMTQDTTQYAHKSVCADDIDEDTRSS